MISRSKEAQDWSPFEASDQGISTCALWQLLLRCNEGKRVACSSCQVVGLVEREVAFEVKVEVGLSQYLRLQKEQIQDGRSHPGQEGQSGPGLC